METGWQILLGGVWLGLLAAGGVSAEPPRVTSDRYELELVAENPEIVTPVGMTFDSAGRLLVVESHTHKRMPDYKGPESDRIRMLSDSDGDGKLDRWTHLCRRLSARDERARPAGRRRLRAQPP